MRSGELARLAGVTVRALRHYHEVGVLAEPRRDSNDYRSYGLRDLVRLLRIKRLAAVGIPLDRMSDLLDDTDRGGGDTGDSGALLDELDAELATQIDQLTRRRAVIAQLRDHRAAPDVPPELAPFYAVWATSGISPELMKADREHSVLLAHLLGAEGMPQLAHFYERMSDPATVQVVSVFAEQFGRLGAGSTEQDIMSVVDSFGTAFGGLIAEFADHDLLDVGASSQLLSEYTAELLNEQQRQALERIEARFADR
ncbi:MerR family transcriptional regulator [Promicromonospora iranensis]|uniref:DNA-binding transcriptional MerR regulator n=1 Tax=Promicromonospora iranensis TaxID=1105144 RepID=A0ABU2CKZ7_9MICO|nr:MerR family transcriptional regulator [Promicromonospora iranensis]MDR7381988.1 DNA-binding transcriptional MerR regulator [Promicromonospora iranensis]